jgi:uncharacterized protein YfaS (alpha-2-macroglobulin family)
LEEDGAIDRLSAYLFTDRGLYRPGETAHLGMIVRSGNWKGACRACRWNCRSPTHVAWK